MRLFLEKFKCLINLTKKKLINSTFLKRVTISEMMTRSNRHRD